MPGPGAFLIGDEERAQVEEVMRTGHLSRYGKAEEPGFTQKVFRLEKEFAAFSGVPYCIATSSGTSSLLVALIALGIGRDDEVIVPAYTFVASYSAIIFSGAVPVLAEIDESLTLDPDDIEHRITERTKAIMPVHMIGNCCDMDRILAIAAKHHLYVIEDCCQAAGASYKGRKVGSMGHFGCFSLNIFKTVTAGDGGMIITSDEELYRKAFGIHDQGHEPNRTDVAVGERSILGLNFRVNELTGAVALAQVRKLDSIISTLRSLKRRLKERLENIPDIEFRRLPDPEGECATLLGIILPNKERAAEIAARLETKTLDRSGWHVYSNMEHILRYFKERGIEMGKGSFPRTDDILERTIILSIGVVDPGVGSGFGININSTTEEIEQTAQEVVRAFAV